MLRDKVMAGANGGNLNSDGVHILTQGNPALLRLVPIGVKPCGEHMRDWAELEGTSGSPSSGSPALGVETGASSSVSSFESPEP